jgi:EpsI family protein
MTTKRAAVLFAVLLLGLGSVFALPKAPATQPLGIDLELPKMVGGWYGKDLEVSERERTVLGPETEFARKAYRNGRGDEIQVSIVLSGQDMNTSIHRPERCLPAQGWTIANKRGASLRLGDRGMVPLTRLQSLRPYRDESGTTAQTLFNLSYYCFIGHTDVTGSHLDRTRIDITDRVLKGYNQRWAYLTAAATITDKFHPGGLNEQQTDTLLREFVQKLVPRIAKETVQFN